MPGFNPRPLLLTGESTPNAKSASPSDTFQSTPVIANGRIHAKSGRYLLILVFQSTPVIANGRILVKNWLLLT